MDEHPFTSGEAQSDASARAAGGTVHREPVIEHRTARQRRGRGKARMALNLTAMIDVTFLLMIYFLLATQFKLGEEVYKLDLPPRLQSDRERDPFELDDEPVRILVTSFGPARSQYRITIDGTATQPDTFDELHRLLAAARIGGGNVGGLYEPDHPVVIQPSTGTRWEHAIEAFNAAHRALYTNINFAQPE